MEVLVILLIGIAILALAIHSYYQSEQRKQELLALATRLGWQFTPGKDRGFDARYGFEALQKGSNRYAYNVLRGPHANHQACCFDYHYETYSTDSKGNRKTHHHYFSAVVLDTALPLKPLFLRPEGFFDRVGELFGFDDIDFESAQFSREFFVKADDRKWAFDVIHQATMEYLLTAPRFTIEFAGPRVIACRSSTFSPAEFEQALEVIVGVIERLPNYLLREWKGAVR